MAEESQSAAKRGTSADVTNPAAIAELTVSIRCKARNLGRHATGSALTGGIVSIRCKARNLGRLKAEAQTAFEEVSIRCKARNLGRHGNPVFLRLARSLNPLQSAEPRQTVGVRLDFSGYVSIRCKARNLGRPSMW